MVFTATTYTALESVVANVALWVELRAAFAGLDGAGVPLTTWTPFYVDSGQGLTCRLVRGGVGVLECGLVDMDPTSFQTRILHEEGIWNRATIFGEVRLMCRVYSTASVYEEEILFEGFILQKPATDRQFSIYAVSKDWLLKAKTAAVNYEANHTGKLLVNYRLWNELPYEEGFDTNDFDGNVYSWGVSSRRLRQVSPTEIDNLLAFANYNWVGLTVTPGAPGSGTLPVGEYVYVVTCLFEENGVVRESFPSYPYDGDGSVLVASVPALGSADLLWVAPTAPANHTLTGYKIYRIGPETSGGVIYFEDLYADLTLLAPTERLVQTLGAGAVSWSDTGTVPSAGIPPRRRRAFSYFERLWYGYQRDPGVPTDPEYHEILGRHFNAYQNSGIIKFNADFSVIENLLQAEITAKWSTAVFNEVAAVGTAAKAVVGRVWSTLLEAYDEHTVASGDVRGNVADILKALLMELSPDGVGATALQVSEITQQYEVGDTEIYDPVVIPRFRSYHGDGPLLDGAIAALAEALPQNFMVGWLPATGRWYGGLQTQKVQENPAPPPVQIRDADITLHTRESDGFRYDYDAAPFASRIVVTVEKERPVNLATKADYINLLDSTLDGAQTAWATNPTAWRQAARFNGAGAGGDTGYHQLYDLDPNTAWGYIEIPNTGPDSMSGDDPFGVAYPINYNASGDKQADKGYQFIPFGIFDLADDPGNYATGVDFRVKTLEVYAGPARVNQGGNKTFLCGIEFLVARDADITAEADLYIETNWRRPHPAAKRDDLTTNPPERYVVEDLVVDEFRWVLIRAKPYKDEDANVDDPFVGFGEIGIYGDDRVEVVAELQARDSTAAFYGGGTFDITGVDAANDEFEIADDWTSVFVAGDIITTSGDSGAPANDGDWTVVSSSFAGGTTSIKVSGNLVATVTPGQIDGGAYEATLTQLMGKHGIFAASGEAVGHVTRVENFQGEVNEVAAQQIANELLEDALKAYASCSWKGRFIPVRHNWTVQVYDHHRNRAITFFVQEVQHRYQFGPGGAEFTTTIEGRDFLVDNLGAT